MDIPFLKKYQPKVYSDFFINDNLIKLLKILIMNDSLNLLLIGNIGSGKTSLLGATIREYYNLDIIPTENIMYINNLQEQGIQYYRNEVKCFCQTASIIQGKKKFVILDDIDRINDQSQQVFRNCIDKYSHNVHFLASCSNTQKVIDSIQSRCAIIKIKPINNKLLQQIFITIKDKEHLKITENAKKFILNVCNNSIRLLINYMEKFKLLDINITEQRAQEICTNISFYEFEKYTKEIFIYRDLKKAIKIIFSIFKKGYSVIDILDNYFIFIKTSSIIDEIIKYNIIKIICKYICIFHTIHEDEIELVFFTNDIYIILNKQQK